MRIGVLGGTFDPIHVAHLIIAEAARVQLALEEVVFIPTGQPWLKANQPISAAEMRFEMVRLAVASNPFFRLSSIEVDRPGPTYSVDTLEALREQWGQEAEVYFILGLDSLKGLPKWKNPARVLELCALVAFVRPEHEDRSLKELEEIAPGASKKVSFLDDPQIGISGTDIRRRVARGISIRYLVPEEVERFILEHGLYGKEEADG